VITDRDICVAAATRGLRPEEIYASQAMTTALHSCLPQDRIDDVLSAMKRYQVRRLPVVDDAGEIKGVVSMTDVARVSDTQGGPSASSVVAALTAISEPRDRSLTEQEEASRDSIAYSTPS
jgi:signal-transduction protein with cAMP-binding, CBS, and nucleotidyltransferase domain